MKNPIFFYGSLVWGLFVFFVLSIVLAGVACAKDFTFAVNAASGEAVLGRLANMTVTGSGYGVWSFSPTTGFVGIGSANPCYLPAVKTNYSGLQSSVPTNVNMPGKTVTVFYRWNSYTTGPVYSFTVTMEDSVFKLTSGGTVGPVKYLDPFAITLTVGGDLQTVTSIEPGPNAPPLLSLDKFFGKDLTVPYFVAPGVNSVEVVIGGQTLTFPVSVGEGDSGGVALLNLPIPTGWNGSAKINGVDIALAPRIAYTGTPSMPIMANPYAEKDAALPAGMTRGIPALPAGVTPTQYYGLPAGMTEGTKLPLPAGMTAISSGSSVGGTLPVGMTRDDGSKIWTVGTASSRVTATSSGGTTTAVKSGADTKATDGLSDTDKDAIVEGSINGVDAGEVQEATSGLKTLGTQWDTLKTTAQNKVGAFRPLQTGSIPKASSLDMTFNFGTMGTREVHLDLTQSPFSVARQISLVLVIVSAGWFFLKYVKI